MENKTEKKEETTKEEKVEKVSVIKEITDYSKIVSDIKIVPVKTKTSTFYNMNVILTDGTILTYEGRYDATLAKLVTYLNTCARLNVNGVTSKKLVEEANSDGAKYICVRIILTDGSVFRFFITKIDACTVNLIYNASL